MPSGRLKRRQALKALAGIPVLGLFGWEFLRKLDYDRKHNYRREILEELGLGDLGTSIKQVHSLSGGDLIRVGIVGFGVRGNQLARALGFMDSASFQGDVGEDVRTQIQYGNLNVALTGICDVFDLHAEKGIETARHDIHTRGEFMKKHPPKCYGHYHDMLADPAIDAVIICTPDHHHAQMTRDAIRAGKHVYCEKGPVLREEEIQPVYEAVKSSDRVFQLGHQSPQNVVFQQAGEILRRGILGKITHAETTTNRNTQYGAWIRHLDGNGNPKPGNEKSINWKEWLGPASDAPFSIERFYGWARYFDYDTGLFGQLFSHEYDTINQLLDIGIPSSVVASGGQYVYKNFGDIPDVLHTVFEYPDKGLTLTYSANLASSKTRPCTLYGSDASMTIGEDMTLTPDGNSQQYAGLLERGVIDPSEPMLSLIKDGSRKGTLDAVTSASVQYYAARGLTSTLIDGQVWDLTHLHVKEWIDCIRCGGETSTDIEKAYVEGVTLAMADISYRENCRTAWDPINKRIRRV